MTVQPVMRPDASRDPGINGGLLEPKVTSPERGGIAVPPRHPYLTGSIKCS